MIDGVICVAIGLGLIVGMEWCARRPDRFREFWNMSDPPDWLVRFIPRWGQLIGAVAIVIGIGLLVR